MNTFVPSWEGYRECARKLDGRRLVKQVAECAQLLRQLDVFPHGGWSNHPAVRMWVGFDDSLFTYMDAMHDECLYRSYNPHAEYDRVCSEMGWLELTDVKPPWWGCRIVHQSHAVALELKALDIKPSYWWPHICLCCTGGGCYECNSYGYRLKHESLEGRSQAMGSSEA